jgi:transcriptional regulator with XRE-family HTH domain
MQALCSISTNAGYSSDMKTGRPSERQRPPFGQRLYELREAAGLTQAQVAAKLGISHRAYAFWEREPTAVRAEQLATLTELFGVTADFLIGRQPSKQRGTGPTGKMRQLFEAASNLPRRQQQKIIGQVEDFLVARGAINGANGHS